MLQERELCHCSVCSARHVRNKRNANGFMSIVSRRKDSCPWLLDILRNCELILDVDWCKVHCCLFNVFTDEHVSCVILAKPLKRLSIHKASYLYSPILWLQVAELFIWKPCTWLVKWPPNWKFVQSNSHLGRTSSVDRPLFWALFDRFVVKI